MTIIADAESKEILQKILSLEPDRRKHVIRIMLQHGKEQGMSEEVADLLTLCNSDKYAAEVLRSLI